MSVQRLLAITALTAGLAAPLQAATLDIDIAFDDYPADISWEVLTTDTQSVAKSPIYGFALAGTVVRETIELAIGDYLFVISDSYGDGLCCNEGAGGYELSLDSVTIFKSNGQFGSGETRMFSVVAAPAAVPLPAGMTLLLSAFGGLALMRKRRVAL